MYGKQEIVYRLGDKYEPIRGFMKKELRTRVYNKYNAQCAYCGKIIQYKEMQVDHVLASYRHGKDSLKNYNPACRSCNSTKGTYTVEEFRKRLIEDVSRLRRDSPKYRILERFGVLGQLKTELKFYFEKIKLNRMV